MHYELLEDYLNDNESGRKYSVNSFENRGTYIEFNGHYTWCNGQEGLNFENERVSLFDLIAWVYSKK